MKSKIGGYTYFDNKTEAVKSVTNTKDQVVAYEGGLGWYVHSSSEYARNPRKRIFGF